MPITNSNKCTGVRIPRLEQKTFSTSNSFNNDHTNKITNENQ